ncbi:hypothetical protein J2783_001123 [Chryseobacterium sediminis]|nr:hypothetical protein [Chryseobacterium sediminis]
MKADYLIMRPLLLRGFVFINLHPSLNVTKPKNEDLLIINYEHEDNIRLQSDSVTIDFYLLAIN